MINSVFKKFGLIHWLVLVLALATAGCDKPDVPTAVAPDPVPVQLKANPTAAAKATDYRQGLCQSMQESMNRLATFKTPAEAVADLASVGFILNNMMGAYPAESVSPYSRLKPQALEQMREIAALRDDASKAALAMSKAKNTVEFAKTRLALANSCMACHSALTTGISPVIAAVR